MDETPKGCAIIAIEAIQRRLGNDMPDPYLGPLGDYLCLKRNVIRPVSISISCADLLDNQYSVQICLDGDPLNIDYDDVCDLQTLVELCAQYFTSN